MDGVINVYKPIGMTSFEAVKEVRKISNTKKVGHTGTLDPQACGVLPICIGRATKIVDYIMKDFKVYKASLILGVVTDTYDREGKIIKRMPVHTSYDEVKNVIKSFIGEIYQIPPMYSAIKVNGKRLYELARCGIEVERKPRKITIHSIEINEFNLPEVTFTVKCSKGTYIRSLCYDIGEKLGFGASMWALERIQSGNFKKENSINVKSLNLNNINNYLISIESALSNFKSINIPQIYEKPLLNGVTISDESLFKDIPQDVLYRVYIDNTFIGLGEKVHSGFKIFKFLM